MVKVEHHVGALQQFVADAAGLQHFIDHTGGTPRGEVDGAHAEDDGLAHHRAALALPLAVFADAKPAVLEGDKSYLFHISIYL